MLDNFKKYLRLSRHHGFANAAIFALYKLFPRQFMLLSQRVSPAATQVWADISGVDYKNTINSVLDYSDWVSFGGAETPTASSHNDGLPVFIWFVPDWSNVWGGGHYTLFRFANHFCKRGSRNIIYIYNNERHSSPKKLQGELDAALKDCRLEVITDTKLLPACDGAVATTWQSAYDVRAFGFAKRKFYFMQDYESQFYAFGTASMQANATYAFGFVGMTGGTWLKSRYQAHGGLAENYRFAADKNIFYPADSSGTVRSTVKRLFFYGRPSTERRCFELGMAALAKIAEQFPDVEIIIAGLDLKAPPPFNATLLGNMTLEATGDLYRTCDVGMAFSGTNLSYLPVELMASGVPVISNNGPQVEWHCKHMENSYLVDPAPMAVLAGFAKLYEDAALRQHLANGGLATMKDISWEEEMSKAFDHFSANLA